MSARASLRKGWCPGALAPMAARDGLLVRLRISGGIVAAPTLREIARASRAFGNGLVDLSARGNLQLRGVGDASLPALIAALDALHLIDSDAGAEAVRNVMSSPLAGLAGAFDVGPIARALEAALIAARDLHRLPGKFGFLIDDGGALTLAGEPADVRFDHCIERRAFAVAIGGDAWQATQLGLCAPGEVVAVALALARAFLGLGSAMAEPPRRMAALIEARGAAAIAAAAGLRADARLPSARRARRPVGLMTIDGGSFFGAGAPFGRLTADMLDAAAGAADIFGSGEIRLTPWRAVIAPGVDPASAAALRRHFAAAAFIVAPDDPRLAVAACGGAPACARATTDTHGDALALAGLAHRLAERLDGGAIALHVSGCAKGCARPRATPFTLVGDQGRYDLVVGGAAADRSLAHNLDVAAAADLIAALARAAGANRQDEGRGEGQ